MKHENEKLLKKLLKEKEIELRENIKNKRVADIFENVDTKEEVALLCEAHKSVKYLLETLKELKEEEAA